MFSIMKDYFIEKRRPYNIGDEESVEGKVVVITGSSSGIGEVAALEFAKRGAIVIMACRDLAKAEKVMEEIKRKSSNERVELVELDLGDLASVRKCSQAIRDKHDQINILINNGGVFFSDGVYRRTMDGFEVHLGVNHLGHFLFTMLLLDLVKNAAPSRIVVTSSMMSQMAELDFDDLMSEKRGAAFGYGNSGPYAISKLSNLYFASALAKKVRGSGVTTYVLCPGFVKTGIFRNDKGLLKRMIRAAQFWISFSPEQGAKTILHCALSKNCANESGKMYRFNAIWKEATEKVSNNDENERKLWETSLILLELEEN